VNHTWCFLHIVNLCPKSIVRQFDIHKKDTSELMDDTECELQNLTQKSNLKNSKWLSCDSSMQLIVRQTTPVKMMMMILMGGWMRWPSCCFPNGQNYMKRLGM